MSNRFVFFAPERPEYVNRSFSTSPVKSTDDLQKKRRRLLFEDMLKNIKETDFVCIQDKFNSRKVVRLIPMTEIAKINPRQPDKNNDYEVYNFSHVRTASITNTDEILRLLGK